MTTAARPPTAIGAIVMAGGIFGSVALQHMPAAALATKPLAAVLATGWAASAAALLRSAAREGFAAHTGPVVGSFAIGTWVAASAVVARMFMLAAPGAMWPVDGLFALSVAVWLWFVPRALRNLWRIAAAPAAATRPTGVILLTTVATQAVALLALRLFPESAAVGDLALWLTAAGAGAYLAGAGLIVRRYLYGAAWRLAADWDNTNCILHGALSITGLAMVAGGAVEPRIVRSLWALDAAILVAVEAFELARLAVRVRSLGWREAVFCYDTSQWARNFTFGMFYAFTAALAERFGMAPEHPVVAAVQGAVLAFGQYAVLALLAIEVALMARWLTRPG